MHERRLSTIEVIRTQSYKQKVLIERVLEITANFGMRVLF